MNFRQLLLGWFRSNPPAASDRAHGLQPERVFLALALTFGLAVLAANPPFQAADEYEHFFRAFQLSEGTLIGQKQGINSGGVLPVAINGIATPGDIPGHPERKVTKVYFHDKAKPATLDWKTAPRGYLWFPHTVINSPLGYFPQLCGITVGKSLRLGPLAVMYLARLFGFAVSVGLSYSALRRATAFRWSLMLLLVSPMTLYLMGSVAPDGLLISGGALLAVLMARAATDPEHRVTVRETIALFAVGALLPVAKFPYFPLTALIPFFYLPRIRTIRSKIWFMGGWTVFCVIPLWIWIHLIPLAYVRGRSNLDIDPARQIDYISAHPLEFLSLVAQTAIAQYGDVYRGIVGRLGWADTALPTWFYNVFGGVMLVCLWAESAVANTLRPLHRLLLGGSALATILLVYFSQYAGWNPVGSPMLEGVFGRYFLPIIPSMFFCLPPLFASRAERHRGTGRLASGMALVTVVVCLWAVVTRFYIP
jgi:uncharacterized membrane protein